MEKPYKIFSVIILAVLLMSLNGCGSKSLSEDQQVYAGKWVAEDGSWINIYMNGKGDFDLGNQTLTGGKVEITESTLSMGIMGINKDFTITQKPEEKDGTMVMPLDNIEYLKE